MVAVGEEAGMIGGDPQAAVDDCGMGSAGKPPPVKGPHLSFLSPEPSEF